MNIALLDEAIKNVAELNCDEFSNFFRELMEINQDLEVDHQDEVKEFLNESLNIVSEEDLVELTDYEKDNFIDFIENLY